MRHLCARFSVFLWRRLSGRREILVRAPQTMLQRHLRRIAQPFGDHVEWKFTRQFAFSAGAEILERLGPGGDSGPLELRPQVAILSVVLGKYRGTIAAPRHVQRLDRGQLVGLVQNRPQLGKESDHSARFTVPPGRVGAVAVNRSESQWISDQFSSTSANNSENHRITPRRLPCATTS